MAINWNLVSFDSQRKRKFDKQYFLQRSIQSWGERTCQVSQFFFMVCLLYGFLYGCILMYDIMKLNKQFNNLFHWKLWHILSFEVVWMWEKAHYGAKFQLFIAIHNTININSNFPTWSRWKFTYKNWKLQFSFCFFKLTSLYKGLFFLQFLSIVRKFKCRSKIID